MVETEPIEEVNLKNIGAKLPDVLKDLAMLKNPAIDAAIVGVVVAVVSPFGINMGPTGGYVTAGLLALGTVATAITEAVKQLKAAK